MAQVESGGGWTSRAALLLTAVAAALDLRQFMARRSLWLDEAFLALNILQPRWLRLTHPLDYFQVAPLPFLEGVRGAVALFGPGERALRLVSLVAGLLLPGAVWLVARRIVSRTWALLPVALVAVAPVLTYYANELKPYELDALATVLIVLLGLRVSDNPADARAWRALGWGTAALLLASLPAVFAAASVFVALVLQNWRRPSGHLRKLIGLALAWGGVFAVAYAIARRLGGTDAGLGWFWEASFPHLKEAGAADRVWKLAKVSFIPMVVDTPTRHTDALLGLALLLSLLGAVGLWRRDRWDAVVMCVGPLMLAGIAAALDAYPLSLRTMLFGMPLLLLLLSSGVQTVAGFFGPVGRAVGVAGALLLIAPGVVVSMEGAVHPHRREDLRPVIQQMLAQRRSKEPIYIAALAVPAWTYYSTDWTHPDTERLEGIRQSFGHGAPSMGGQALRWESPAGVELYGFATGTVLRPNLPRPRAPVAGWAEKEAARIKAVARPSALILFSHVEDNADQALAGALAAEGGTFSDRIEAEGAAAYRVRFQ